MPNHQIDVADRLCKPGDLDGLRQALCYSFAVSKDDMFADLIARLERVEATPTVFARTDQSPSRERHQIDGKAAI